MDISVFIGAVEIGLIYAFVGIGVYLSFRVLDFPDLTVDGSFVLGGAVFALMIVNGWNPWLGMAAAFIAGAMSGLVTALLNLRFQILNLLASILTMTALYTVNLRVMGGSIGSSNLSFLGSDTIITPFYGLFGLDDHYIRPLVFACLVLIAIFIVWRYLSSEAGLAMRASGINPRMAKAQGVSTSLYIYKGMALSNALVAFGGALFSQINFFSDITSGPGTIVFGLAAVIIGEAIFRTRNIFILLFACVMGSVIFRVATQFALEGGSYGISTVDMQLITALIVALFLIVPRLLGAKNYD